MRDRLLRGLLHDRLVVTLRSGETFDGLFIEADERVIRLANADLVTEKSRVSVDGDLYLPRYDVIYMQKPRSARDSLL